ncbi:MAG: hypothetical protein LRS46_00550 [Desulfurococcales archaeon]|nr:hypothetical protein [Desulfurococcales archaeon]
MASIQARHKAKQYAMFPEIFLLGRKPSSQCEYFKVEKTSEGRYAAYCEVLGRYLTVYQVEKCEKYWRTCPYRRFGGFLA